MDTERDQTDAILDEIAGIAPTETPVSPEADATTAQPDSTGVAAPDDDGEDTSFDDADDLPDDALDTESASPPADASPSPDAPDPQADVLARLEAAEQRAAEAERLNAEREQQARAWLEQQRAEQQRRAEQQQRDKIAAERIQWMLDNIPPGEHEAYVKRLTDEVYVAPVVQEAQQQVQRVQAERDQIETELGATAAAMWMAAQDMLPADQLDQFKQLVEYRRKFPTPTAMQENAERERRLREQVRKEVEAEFERKRNKAAAQRRQQRIASGVDTVPAGAGAVATDTRSDTDRALDALFG